MSKICMLARFFPYVKGQIIGHGTPQVVYNLLKELPLLGVQVDVIAEGKNRCSLSVDNALVHYVPFPYEFYSLLKRIKIYSKKPHILHSHGISCLSHSFCRSLWKSSFLIQLHHSIPITPRVSNTLKILFHFADRVLLLNEFEAAKARKSYGVPREKLVIMPNGVDTELFKPLKDEGQQLKKNLDLNGKKIILSIGRPSPFKGHEYLIAAMYDVIKEIPDAHLLIVGLKPESNRDAEYIQNLVKKSREYGVRNNLTLVTDFIPHNRLKVFYSAADVYVLPSLVETWGLVILEAMSCGTPVVATRVGSAPDIITSDVGLIVPPKSVDDLGSAIIKILTSNKTEEMGSNARDLILKKYTWRKVALRLIEVYRKVSETSG